MKKLIFLCILTLSVAFGVNASSPPDTDVGLEQFDYVPDIIQDIEQSAMPEFHSFTFSEREHVRNPFRETTYNTLDGVKNNELKPPANSQFYCLFITKKFNKPLIKVPVCYNCATGYWC